MNAKGFEVKMISLRHICLAGLVALALSGCLNSPPPVRYTNIHYEAVRDVDLADVLPPPPVEGSAEDKKDLAEVLAAQITRTPEQIKEAELDSKINVFRFGSVMGDKFTEQNLPITAAFFKKVEQDVGYSVYLAKIHYKRPRPFIESALIKPLILKPTNTSYPSGHSAYAYTTALLLSKIVPEKSAQIFSRAYEFAYNRIIDGVHYPSDITAGRISASIIVHEMLQDPEFMADFNKSEQEVRSIMKREIKKAKREPVQ
jgi:acid phosphatase (class A)